MPPESKAPRALSVEKLSTILETKLEDESFVLASMIQALGRDELPAPVWSKLHEAAQRDDRLLELAAAYEEWSQPRMIRRLTAPQQAEVLFHAAEFLRMALEDTEGALDHLQKAVAAHPGHAEAFDRLENLLIEAGNGEKLCELYVTASAHRATKEEQLQLLRRAAELADVFADEAHRALPIYERLVKLEPGDAEARRALETWYRRANRWSELAKALEQVLGQEGVDDAEVRGKLIDLYLGELQQPDRAIGHVEEMLKRDAASSAGREGARRLLAHKMLGARAALALEGAYERSGEVGEVVRVLGALVEATRGQQRTEAQKRLGKALMRTGQEAEAFAVLEKVATSDASDEDVRAAFRQSGQALGKQAEVARVLLRAASASKSEGLRAQLNLEAGEALFEAGDIKRARPALQAASEGGEGSVRLVALRLLGVLLADEPRALAEALSRQLGLEPEGSERSQVAARLGEVWQGLGDSAQAIAAWRQALDGPQRARAEAALGALYEQAGQWAELVGLLKAQGERGEGQPSRAALERAARLLADKLNDADGAIAAWGRVGERFGRGRQVIEQQRLLLERAGRRAEVVEALLEEIALAPAEQQGELWGRVAQLRLELGDGAGALLACREGLRAQPGEVRCATVAARLLDQKELRLAAAEGLLPIYREQADFWGLVRALEVLGTEAPEVSVRLSALDEAVRQVAGDEPARALRLAAEGLRLSVEHQMDAVPDWLVQLELLSAAAEGPTAHAALLLGALGSRPLAHPALIDLARRAAEALVEGGKTEEALPLLDRVFKADPTLARGATSADRVLAARGDLPSRIALWRSALAHEPEAERKVEILKLLATLERQHGGLEAAAEALRQALAIDANDRAARAALVDCMRSMGQRQELAAELERTAAGLEGAERRRVLEELASLALALGQAERAAGCYDELLRDGPLGPEQLEEAEQAATQAERPALLVRVLRGRVEASGDDGTRATLLERLGGLLSGSEPGEAVEAWRQAARLRAGLGRVAEARALYRKILDTRDDDGALDELLALERAAGDAAAQADLLLRKLRQSRTAGDEVEALVALGALAAAAGRVDAFEEAAEKPRHGWSSEQRQRVLSARARVLGSDPARREQAAEAHRALIELARSPEAMAAFEAFLEAGPRDDRWKQDRRWILAFRAEHGGDTKAALLAWAHEEEGALGDQAAAIELYRRLLVLDPTLEEAQRRLVPLLLAAGDVEGARKALLSQRAQAQGEARRRLDLELSALLLDRLGRPADALGALWPLLSANAADAEALALVERALGAASGAEHEGLRRRAVEALERGVEASEPAAAEALLGRLLAQGVGDPEARRGWYGSLLDRLDEAPERALEVALRAVREAPLEMTLWDRAEQAARRLDRPRDVIEAYRERLSDPTAAAQIGERALDFYEEWSDDPQGAMTLLERVLVADVGAKWAFDRLKVSYGASEQWGELLSLYDRMINDARSDNDRCVFLEDAAQIAKDFAGDDSRAIGYLERLSELRRGDEALTETLERLYERAGRYQDLIALLTHQLPQLDVATAQRQRARIAALWLDGVGDVSLAFAVIETMLAVNAEEPEALALLERLLGTFRRPAAGAAAAPAAVAAAYQKAAALLKSRYEQAGRYADLVRVHEVELSGMTQAEARAEALRGLIALRLDRVGDLEGAFDDTAALLALEPRSEATRQGLSQLADRLGAHERLVAVLTQLGADEGAAALWLAAARVAAGPLGDTGRAVGWYRQAIERRGDDASAALSAARELGQLLAVMAGQEAERYRVLAEQASLEPTAEGRRPVLAQMAALARGPLGDFERLAQAWQARLDDEPNDEEALSGLIEAYEGLGRWAVLVGVLQRRARVAADPERQRLDLEHAARVLADRLGSIDRALDAWVEVRERFGTTDESVDATAALLERASRHDALAALLAEQAPQAATRTRRGELLGRLGEVERKLRSRPEQAVEAYGEALALDPENAVARAGLEALTQEPAARAGAVRALLLHHRRSDDWRGIARLLELRIELAADELEQSAILGETASLLEQRGGDLPAAFETLRRALRLRPNDRALADEALRLSLAAGLFDAGVEALRAAAEDPRADRASARSLWTTLAEVQSERAPAAAEAAYQRALAVGGDDAALLRALVALQRKSRGRPLVDGLLRLAPLEASPTPLLLEAARVALDELSDAELARRCAAKILDAAGAGAAGAAVATEHWSDQREAVDWAIEALTGAGPARLDAAQRAQLLRRVAQLSFAPERKADLLRQAARISEEELGDLESAIQGFSQILTLLSDDLDALAHLARLYRRLGRRGELLGVLRRQIAAQTDAAARTALRVDLAKLLRDTGEVEQAIEALREGLAETPGDGAAALLLEQLYEATGRAHDLTQLVERQAERREAEGDAAAAELWARAGALAEERLDDAERAAEAHRRAGALGRRASSEALARLLLARGDHAEAIQVLERLAADAQGEELVAALRRLAEAYVAAGRRDDAQRVLEQAASHAADPEPIQARLVELYREAGDWGRLADLMVSEATSTRDPRLRAARLREAAELLLGRQSNPTAAVPLLREASELAPDDAVIQLLLGESLRLVGHLDESIAALRRLVDSYGSRRPKDRALAHHQLGLALRATGDRAAALAELETGSRIDPAHPRILHALGQVASEVGELDRAQKALRSLLLLLPRGARGDQGVSRVEVQLGLADLARRQGDAARADELIESAFAHARDLEGELSTLEDGLRSRGLHGPLARSLEARLAAGLPPSQAVPILRELASFYHHHLNQPADGLDRLRRAIALAPQRPELRQEALEIARATGDVAAITDDLATLAASLAPAEAALDLWIEAAELAERELSDDARAIAALTEAEALATRAPAPAEALGRVWPRLEAVLRRSQQTDALAALLGRRAEAAVALSAPADEQAEPLYRLAELLLPLPAPRPEAIEAFERALSLDPQLERAEAVLERAVAVHETDEPILRLYERFCRAHGRGRALVEALRRLGALPGAGTAALREAAELAIQIGDDASADAVLRDISELDQSAASLPDVIWALVSLAGRLEARGDVSMAASLKERAAEVAPVDERRRLLLDVAALARGPLHDPPRAARLLGAVLDSHPGDPEAWRPLADIHRHGQDDARLAQLLEGLLPLVDGSERGHLRDELVAVLLRERALPPAEGLKRAIDLLRDTLADNPDDATSAQRLAELLERSGDIDALAEHLERLLDAARDRRDLDATRSLALRLASLYEQRRDDRRSADVLRAALEVDPSSHDLLRALLTVAERRDDAFEIAEVLERLLGVETGPAAAELALRLSALHDANWNPESAERALEKGHEIHPTPALRDQLVERYTDSGAWAKLAALLERDAASQPTPAARVAALQKAADVHRKHLSAPAAAADLLQQALTLAPLDRPLLRSLLDALGAMSAPAAPRRAIDALTFALEQKPGDPELLRLRGERHAALGAFEAAIADLEACLAAGDSTAATALVAALRQAIPLARGAAAQRPLRLRLASLLGAAGDNAGAREQLEAASRSEPSQPDVLRALVDLERRAGRPEATIAPLKSLADASEGTALANLAIELSEAADAAGKPAEARSALERAVRSEPRRKPLRERLRSLYERLGARRELAAFFREEATLAPDPASRFEALLAAARLLLDPQQGDLKTAIQILEEARGLRPDDLELALLLAEAQVAQRHPREAITALANAVASQRGKRSRPLAHVLHRKAQLELGLGERPAALASLNKAFENDAANGQLAMELGMLALEMNDEQTASRAFRAITLMKISAGADDGTIPAAKAQAYYQLSLLALGQADRRKARLLAEKAVAEDPGLEPARILRDELKNG